MMLRSLEGKPIFSMILTITIIGKVHKIYLKYQQKTQIIILKCNQTTTITLAVEVITTTHRRAVE